VVNIYHQHNNKQTLT